MRKIAATLLVCVFLVCGNLAFAQDQECDCEKKIIGIGYGNFGFGAAQKSFNSLPGCDTSAGLGIVLGSERAGLQIGLGYDMGVAGLAFGIRGPKRISTVGIGGGYDYGTCK
jgi:hypothetical protein